MSPRRRQVEKVNSSNGGNEDSISCIERVAYILLDDVKGHLSRFTYGAFRFEVELYRIRRANYFLQICNLLKIISSIIKCIQCQKLEDEPTFITQKFGHVTIKFLKLAVHFDGVESAQMMADPSEVLARAGHPLERLRSRTFELAQCEAA